MPEINLGDLAQNKLFDILKPLFSGKKTGKVTVKVKEGGELYLESEILPMQKQIAPLESTLSSS